MSDTQVPAPQTPTGTSPNTTPAKFFRWQNYLQEGLHLGGAAALTTAVGFWVGPLTLLGCAAGAGVLVVGGNVLFEKIMPEIFTRREVNAAGRTKLDAMVDYFTSRAGLKYRPTLYDMKIDKAKLAKKEENHTTPAQIQRIFNAAAAGVRRPNVLISEDLLEVMEQKETEAVMGHEFAHLGAEHIKLQMAANWLQATTMFSAMFGFGAAVVSGGWLVGMASIAASAGISIIGHKMMPKKEERYARDGTPRPEVRRTQLGILALQEALSIGVLAYSNPAVVLTAFAIEHGFFWSSNLINKSLSRRHEFQADAGAVAMGSNPLSLISSLRKMERALELNEPTIAQSLNWRKGVFYERGLKMLESLFRTHPDTQRRCNRLAKMAALQGYTADEIKMALTAPIDDKILAPATYDEMDVKETMRAAANLVAEKIVSFNEMGDEETVRNRLTRIFEHHNINADFEVTKKDGKIEVTISRASKAPTEAVTLEKDDQGDKGIEALIKRNPAMMSRKKENLDTFEYMSDAELYAEFKQQSQSNGLVDPAIASEMKKRVREDYKPQGPV